MKSNLIAASFAVLGMASASAFSLDFTGLDLSTTFSGADGDKLVIDVPGFGNVAFGVALKDVEATFTEFDEDGVDVTAILFNVDTPITVEFFAGSDVENVVVDFVGVNTGEEPTYTIVTPQSGDILTNKGNVGIAGISFDRVGPKVPEPSTAFLGLIGAVALLRRRR